jgi:hypothetical protein
MWEPQPLTTLRAPKACRGENFTFFTLLCTVLGERILLKCILKEMGCEIELVGCCEHDDETLG